MKAILIAGAEPRDVETIGSMFSDGQQVIVAQGRKEVAEQAAKHSPDIGFIDVRLLLGDAEVLPSWEYTARIHELWSQSNGGTLIVLTPPELLREAVKAVKAGAANYLTIPVDPAELRYVTESLRELEVFQHELDYLRERFWRTDSLEFVRTASETMRDVLDQIRKVTPTTATVLLTGETGVGKSTMAKLIHRHSPRASGPFIAVHCGAIPDTLLESELFGHEKGAFTGAHRRKLGRFEIANGGTLFLDEAGVLTPAAQIKLLNALQDRTIQRLGGDKDIVIDVRLVVATNVDLRQLCDEGRFRRDLFYRLNVFPIEIPPLRQRSDDIPALARQMLRRLQTSQPKPIDGLHPQVLDALQRYDWPGNVRELENLIERAHILETSNQLTPESFPPELFTGATASAQMPPEFDLPIAEFRTRHIDRMERAYLERLLTRHDGHLFQVAAAAGVGLRQLHKLLARHGLHRRHRPENEPPVPSAAPEVN